MRKLLIVFLAGAGLGWAAQPRKPCFCPCFCPASACYCATKGEFCGDPRCRCTVAYRPLKP